MRRISWVSILNKLFFDKPGKRFKLVIGTDLAYLLLLVLLQTLPTWLFCLTTDNYLRLLLLYRSSLTRFEQDFSFFELFFGAAVTAAIRLDRLLRIRLDYTIWLFPFSLDSCDAEEL